MKLVVLVFVAVLLLLQCFSPAARVPTSSGVEQFWDRTTIILYNRIGMMVTLHCKSKDDDLGIHVLEKDESWRFSFDPNFAFSTLFYGSFQWGGETHDFDVYKQTREYMYKEIGWSVWTTGPCCSDPDQRIVCFTWNN
ncbi:hypothetical protein MLD38_000850 [Melastoma candidum]|uniref:Uncharacterized protein n=1 Tax=Melastoma candidum TaxID=119954 RepID=A0ACB9SAV8_9MYRT|nr:hypothetical protein MLD38_000850 [Melastoma candidum]